MGMWMDECLRRPTFATMSIMEWPGEYESLKAQAANIVVPSKAPTKADQA